MAAAAASIIDHKELVIQSSFEELLKCAALKETTSVKFELAEKEVREN